MDEASVAVGKQKTEDRLSLVSFSYRADLAEHHAVRLAADGRGDTAFPRRHALYPSDVFLFGVCDVIDI